jgi:hypothetical protein
MIAFDGNNSLKRVRQVGTHPNGRVFEDSDYFLSHEYVDQFAGEVKSRQPASEDTTVNPTIAEEQNEDTVNPTIAEEQNEDGPNPDGDPTDGAEGSVPCADNWKAAAAADAKRMWALFDETGIFASACRHGFILWIADMIRSGELYVMFILCHHSSRITYFDRAKYPLAMTARIMDVLGDRILLGYDIGCTYSSTLSRSSLGPKYQESGLRCCVNAFHGYSHNYLCQTHNHPNIIEGMGLEDLEGMERIFSGSNQLAPVTRYSTAYRRHVMIDQYFNNWDGEKYLNLGKWLYDNYIQALKIVNEDSYGLEEAMMSLGITGTAQLDEWHKEQVAYLHTLGKEDDYDVLSVAYVELLQELSHLECAILSCHIWLLIISPGGDTRIIPKGS